MSTDALMRVPDVETSTGKGSALPARRDDIQALRGMAIGMVVLHHLDLGFPSAGFLGVDIFFVISGYLVTGMILRDLDRGRFSFRDFYLRRARRLLPAAYATFAVTALLSPLVLDATALRAFFEQLLGALTFTANIVLWRQGDYFAGDSVLRPLLHVWSLSLEEQAYLLLPIGLFIVPRKWRLSGLAILTLASLGLCLFVRTVSPQAAFYLLPTRAWELGIGALLSLPEVQRAALRLYWLAKLRIIAVLSLVALTVFSGPAGHPGPTTIVACLCTALILMTTGPTVFPLKAVVLWLGDRAYALYLVHWPIFAFAAHLYAGPVPIAVTLCCGLLSVLLSDVLYRTVEQQFRLQTNWPPRREALAYFATPLLILGFGLISAPLHDSASLRVGNRGLAQACSSQWGFAVPEACMFGPKPDILLWGDSHAMQLAQGIAATSGEGGLVQVTRSVCGPFVGIAPTDGWVYPHWWAQGCIKFNDSVLDYLAANTQLKTVVISSVVAPYLPNDRSPWMVLDTGGEAHAASVEILTSALARTVEAVRELGRAVVFVAPPPLADIDVGRCVSRSDASLIVLDSNPDCRIEAIHRRDGKIIEALDAATLSADVTIVRFDPLLCDDQGCTSRLDDVALYGIDNHLSAAGSEAIGREMDLAPLLRQLAY